MLVKGIIKRIEDSGYKAYVEIPALDSYSAPENSLQKSRLATICTLPGCKPLYKSGDIVYIDFELDNQSSPVILGSLYTRENQNSEIDIQSRYLEASLESKLPYTTSIGEVTPVNIQTLVNNRVNVSGELDRLKTEVQLNNT